MASGLIQFAFVLASGNINIMPNEVGAGLPAFSGAKYADLFNIDQQTKIFPELNSQVESDSDSDYEYFKVQKQLETKNAKAIQAVTVEEEKIRATSETDKNKTLSETLLKQQLLKMSLFYQQVLIKHL
ncbi:hypothetical protein ACJJTC_010096 [Scirpophaga incertulas]